MHALTKLNTHQRKGKKSSHQTGHASGHLERPPSGALDTWDGGRDIARGGAPNTHLAHQDEVQRLRTRDPVFHFPTYVLASLLCWWRKHMRTLPTGMRSWLVAVQCSSVQSHRLNSCIYSFSKHLRGYYGLGAGNNQINKTKSQPERRPQVAGEQVCM